MTRALALLSFVLALAFTGAIGLSADVSPRELGGASAVGCSPAGRAIVRDGLVHGGCFLLRAITDNGEVHEVCASPEDLAPIVAPLVDELLAEHKDARERGAHVAFALPAALVRKPRAPPKRRCLQWIDLTDAGAAISDAGAGAGD